MQAKFEDELRAAKLEKKELKRTFLQVREETEEERKLYESMQMEQEAISGKIEEEKSKYVVTQGRKRKCWRRSMP